MNVFIPCLPDHGREDRMTDDLRGLTVEELTRFGDNVLDIAAGLGETVTVIGLSGSGTLACWLAQNRPEATYAIPIASFFSVAVLPDFLLRPFANLFLALPNFYVWWDPRTKAKNPYSIYYA